MTYTRLHRAFVLLLTFALFGGCATAGPEVKVIAMSQARAAATASPEVVVYMEVVNPTKREISLSRLDYRLSADSWFSTEGSVGLERSVARESSAVVVINVPVEHLASRDGRGVSYRLQGRLFARANHVERSWSVAASGEIETRRATGFRFPAKVDVADAE